MWWLIIPAVIVAFLLVIIVRALMFKPKDKAGENAEKIEVDEETATKHLAEMIKCATVSYRDKSLEDEKEFDKFKALLRELYPTVYANAEYEEIGKRALLFKIKGESSEAPTVFMAHFDVVPVNEEQWEKPPFSAIIEDGYLWGRGTLDTKITLLGTMEAAESLLKSGFKPKNDIYFSFAGDEETAGQGAPAVVDTLKERGITPQLVVDEGGAVVSNVFPGVKEPCALIGIGEKGMMDIELSVKSKGGHASSPPPHTPVGVLAQAVVDIEKKPFKSQMTPATTEMFDTLGRHSSFVMKLIFANMWCFKGILNMICKKSGGEMNALMRTTCAFTMMKGSAAANVLPPKASVCANMRLLGKDTTDSAIAYLKKVVDNEDIEFRMIDGMNPSIFSDTSCEGYKELKKAIEDTWQGSIVSPYLMIACSDSRHFCRISNKVFRFSAMALTTEERGLIHGNNERIKLDKIGKTIEFYTRLMKTR